MSDVVETGGANGGTDVGGAVFVKETLPAAPSDVLATDGKFENRVEISWTDNSDDEDGFRIFRDNVLISVTGADITSFVDADANPGDVSEYCVQSLKAVYEDVSVKVCDLGWRSPDGAISGKVLAGQGQPSVDINVCMTPSPNGSVILDGIGGQAVSSESTQIPNSFTVEFWAKQSAGSSGTVFSHGTGSTNHGLNLGLVGPGTVRFDFWNNTLDVSGPTDSAWHHYAFSYDEPSNTRKTYIDGTLAGSNTSPTDYLGSGPFYFGSLLGSDFFNGQVDEIRIWNHVVSAADIASRRSETIDVTLPDLGLFAHWSLDELMAVASANDVSATGQFYLRHKTGVAPARPGAPMKSCDLSDASGDYRFSGIRYGESTEFNLIPADPGQLVRTFAPSKKIITLSRQNPVQNEVQFVDLTRYTVAGKIQFDGTICPVEGVVIDVNSGAGQVQTDGDGAFAAAIDPGSATILPKIPSNPDRVFSPPFISLDLTADVFDQNFVDQTVHTLTGDVVGSGMCRIPIGVAQVRLRATNGCLTRDVTTDANGHFTTDLPPMEYSAEILSVANADPVRRVDIEKFFQDRGLFAVDLTTGDLSQDFIYRPPLQVTIAGLPASMCNTADVPDNIPVLAKGDKINLEVSVVEDLGGGSTCPVDSATVTLFSEITDQQSTPLVLAIDSAAGGKVDTTLFVGQPNVLAGRVVDGVERSYQKFVTAVADVDGRKADATSWAIVQGVRPRPGGQFATKAKTKIPMWVLHDPPGDQSFSFIQKGSKFCNSFSAGIDLTISGGVEAEFSAGAEVDLGVTFGGEASAVLKQKNTLGVHAGFSLETAINGGVNICGWTDEEISTSDDEDFFGPSADLFVGTGINFTFAKSDRVTVNECKLTVDDALAVGPELDTAFMFTRDHIQNVMVPELEQLKANATSVSKRNEFQEAIDNWNHMLNTYGLPTDPSSLDPFKDNTRNISYSAGTNFTFERGDELDSFVGIQTTIGVNVGAFVEISADAAGSGVQGKVFADLDAKISLAFEHTTENGTSYGYTLWDDDVGDNYSFDALKDPVFSTPVFDVKAGRSSCPYEPWMGTPLVVAPGASATGLQPRTAPRDIPVLSINPPQQFGVDPNAPALFTVSLGNQSATSEERNYRLGVLQTANPGGAIFEAGGKVLSTGSNALDFFIAPQQTQELELAVRRGPTRFNYDNLGLVMYPICEEGNLARGRPNTADTTHVSVRYTAPCSGIHIFRPKENWTLTRVTAAQPMEITLDEFTLAASDVSAGVQSIGLEYRKVGTSTWLPAFTTTRADVIAQGGANATSYTGQWTFPGVDGQYELRAFTVCDSGRNVSLTVPGTVDTKLPEVLGTPEPADTFLALGDDISITFDEDLSCASIITDGQSPNTTLTRLDTNQTVAITAVCDARRVVITPRDVNAWTTLEGKRLRVSVENWTDMIGNPMAAARTWEFDVRRSAFTWTPTTVNMTVALGASAAFEASLSNGKTTGPVTFTLTGQPAWLVPNLTQGTIPGATTSTVGFTVLDVLSVGTHQATVTATNSDGDTSELTVTVNIFDECIAPVWNVVPSNFQSNMTLTAQLVISGSVSKDANDLVGAFVNGQLRGVAPIVPIDANNDTVFDGNRVSLVIYSNASSGEQVTFQVWDKSTCTVFKETNLNLAFDPTAVHGTPVQPITLQAPPPAVAPGTVPLSSGWTWFSVNRVPQDPSLTAVFTGTPVVGDDIIKNQTQFSLFEPTLGWVGTLSSLDPRKAYLIRLNQSHTLSVVGAEVNTATTPLDVVPGWNWIGYLPQVNIPIDQALGTLRPSTNDIIKSQFAFAQFVQGVGWIGSLTEMNPGLGYLIRVASGGRITYPATPVTAPHLDDSEITDETSRGERITAKRSSVSTTGSTIDSDAKTSIIPGKMSGISSLDCALDPTRYQNTLSLTAVISIDGQEVRGQDFEIGVFGSANGVTECRGLGTFQYVATLDRYISFVVVYGNEDGEELSLKIFDPNSNSTIESPDHLVFGANSVTGTVQAPTVIHASIQTATATEDEGELPVEFGLEQNYPNPFSQVTHIRYALPSTTTVRITIYDLLGREIARLVEKNQSAGRYEAVFDGNRFAPGTYAYRLEAGSFSETKVMVLLR